MSPSLPDAGKSPSFEDALAELEQILRALEAGDVTLEDALSRYETGVGLLKRCYAQLRQAEQRILLLSGEDPDGKPLVQAFDPSSAKPERPDALRRKRPDSAY
jgi:exodeoxyribonuclease VII small subunit